MIRLNCDIGERGIHHPVDIELMNYIDIANIACGGHAGNADSVRFFCSLAEKKGIQISAHLSYPDRENFGRKSIKITPGKLHESLDTQYKFLPHIKLIKFHGALYNDSCIDPPLAQTLSRWLRSKKITTVICPENSALADSCRQDDIKVLGEAFAERNYQLQEKSQQLILRPRTLPYACIEDCEQALHHYQNICKGFVEAFYTHSQVKRIAIRAATVCIHSDSAIALSLAKKIKNV